VLLRILADENLAYEVIAALRGAGHDLVWASELAPRSPDEHWLDLGEAERRLVLTNDKDFGDLIFKSRATSTVGVILLRLGDMKDVDQAELVESALAKDRTWYGQFTVITEVRIRQARLPDLKL
jgi:predicted nuclease of predicted toxin-antitoxin system